MKLAFALAAAILLVVVLRRAARGAHDVVIVRASRTGDGPWAVTA